MTTKNITKIQRDTLLAAAVRNDHTVFPVRSKPALNAGSVAKLVKTLIAKGLAEERIAEGKIPAWRTTDDGQRLAAVITLAGLEAVGMLPAGKPGRSRAAPAAAKQGVTAPVPQEEPRRPRAGTKLAILVGLLERKEGATVAELSKATGWQQHTVRGTISGALQKRFGLGITSAKVDGHERVYRLRA